MRGAAAGRAGSLDAGTGAATRRGAWAAAARRGRAARLRGRARARPRAGRRRDTRSRRRRRAPAPRCGRRASSRRRRSVAVVALLARRRRRRRRSAPAGSVERQPSASLGLPSSHSSRRADDAVAAARRLARRQAPVGARSGCRRRTPRPGSTTPSPQRGSRQRRQAAVGVDLVAVVALLARARRCRRRSTPARSVDSTPSVSIRLPSSHSSPGPTTPSPQRAGRQVGRHPSVSTRVAVVALLARADHAVAAARDVWHVVSAAVASSTWLPSSHCSAGPTTPSPQRASLAGRAGSRRRRRRCRRRTPRPGRRRRRRSAPACRSAGSASCSMALPSSHSSPGSTTPSPQRAGLAGREAGVAVVGVAVVALLAEADARRRRSARATQVASTASLSSALPSSHSSPASTNPSPHVGAMIVTSAAAGCPAGTSRRPAQRHRHGRARAPRRVSDHVDRAVGLTARREGDAPGQRGVGARGRGAADGVGHRRARSTPAPSRVTVNRPGARPDAGRRVVAAMLTAGISQGISSDQLWSTPKPRRHRSWTVSDHSPARASPREDAPGRCRQHRPSERGDGRLAHQRRGGGLSEKVTSRSARRQSPEWNRSPRRGQQRRRRALGCFSVITGGPRRTGA